MALTPTGAAEAVRVRPATEQDRAPVLALLTAAALEAEFEAGEFVVAQRGPAIVGCARLKPLSGGARELASVAVAPSLQGRGVGSQLVRAALASEQSTVYALALAPEFFERHGFRRLGEVPEPLKEKAGTTCAASGFVPMVLRP